MKITYGLLAVTLAALGCKAQRGGSELREDLPAGAQNNGGQLQQGTLQDGAQVANGVAQAGFDADDGTLVLQQNVIVPPGLSISPIFIMTQVRSTKVVVVKSSCKAVTGMSIASQGNNIMGTLKSTGGGAFESNTPGRVLNITHMQFQMSSNKPFAQPCTIQAFAQLEGGGGGEGFDQQPLANVQAQSQFAREAADGEENLILQENVIVNPGQSLSFAYQLFGVRSTKTVRVESSCKLVKGVNIASAGNPFLGSLKGDGTGKFSSNTPGKTLHITHLQFVLNNPTIQQKPCTIRAFAASDAEEGSGGF